MEANNAIADPTKRLKEWKLILGSQRHIQKTLEAEGGIYIFFQALPTDGLYIDLQKMSQVNAGPQQGRIVVIGCRLNHTKAFGGESWMALYSSRSDFGKINKTIKTRKRTFSCLRLSCKARVCDFFFPTQLPLTNPFHPQAFKKDLIFSASETLFTGRGLHYRDEWHRGRWQSDGRAEGWWFERNFGEEHGFWLSKAKHEQNWALSEVLLALDQWEFPLILNHVASVSVYIFILQLEDGSEHFEI